MAQKVENVITLKGSTAIVTEFFGYSINSILYQRGIYPSDTFTNVSKYGLTMLVTKDETLKSYLSNVLVQLSEWLLMGKVQKLVLVLTGAETNQVLERWLFQIENSSGENATSTKDVQVITSEIQAIIRQITASVTFLPLLQESCTFDLLVYADMDTSVPSVWEETDPCLINDSTQVRLRSFTTKIHKVDSMVAYKNPSLQV